MSEPSGKLLEEAVEKPKQKDRRAWVRYSCDRKGACQPVALPTAVYPEDQWGARAGDISAGGLRLFLRRRFETGTLLVVEFPDAGSAKYCVTVKVVRVQAERGGWALGCQIDPPIPEDQLKGLLQSS